MFISPAASCSVLTLNMEGHKHLAEVTALLNQLQPEVVCLQEVFKADLAELIMAVGAVSWEFVPMVVVHRENAFGMAPLGEWGVVILSRLPVTPVKFKYYLGQAEANDVPILDDTNPNSVSRVVAWQDIQIGSEWLRVAVTHFTWSPQASFIPLQAEAAEKLLAIYQQDIQFGLLCGDFNVPRGTHPVYQHLTQYFTDNVPASVTTTLDKNLHRAGDLQLVVDYLFTAGPYTVENCQIHSGVSDHLGLSGRLISYLN